MFEQLKTYNKQPANIDLIDLCSEVIDGQDRDKAYELLGYDFDGNSDMRCYRKKRNDFKSNIKDDLKHRKAQQNLKRQVVKPNSLLGKLINKI